MIHFVLRASHDWWVGFMSVCGWESFIGHLNASSFNSRFHAPFGEFWQLILYFWAKYACENDTSNSWFLALSVNYFLISNFKNFNAGKRHFASKSRKLANLAQRVCSDRVIQLVSVDVWEVQCYKAFPSRPHDILSVCEFSPLLDHLDHPSSQQPDFYPPDIIGI